MYSVYQHWDPLRVCVVGRSYPPEFYSWIKVPHVRDLFERIALETEEDFQAIIKKLQEFGVEVLRPNMPNGVTINGKFLPPPQTPRDTMVMIGNRFYENYTWNFQKAYANVRDPSWPDCTSVDDFVNLPSWIQDECNQHHKFKELQEFYSCYEHIFDQISARGNTVKSHYDDPSKINGAMISRVGRDLYFGTVAYDEEYQQFQRKMQQEFPEYRTHVVNTGGHSDSTYCPVCPGLIVSLKDVPTYQETFPGWEVVYLPEQSWDKVKDFAALKSKNYGKWWIPGFEYDDAVINVVESWLSKWTGYVEETVFDINMLIVDPKNVIVFNYNKQVFDALERYGITPHVIPFRHRYFWDGGIHCVTADLHREGTMQDYFPERS